MGPPVAVTHLCAPTVPGRAADSPLFASSWWYLGHALRAKQDKLVSLTEDILSAELTSWTQKLSEAMAKMEAPPKVEEKTIPAAPARALTSSGVEAIVGSKVHTA